MNRLVDGTWMKWLIANYWQVAVTTVLALDAVVLLVWMITH